MKKQPKNRGAKRRRRHGVFLLAAPLPLIVFSKVPFKAPTTVSANVTDNPGAGTSPPLPIDSEVLAAAKRSATEHGLNPQTLAIADMSQPSTAQRLYVIDMQTNKVVLRTWIAHGQRSGDVTPTKFSNRTDSHETSLGLYRVGSKITSPKHGPALLLHGLDKGINDQALAREVIIHGASYVSAMFIALHGRLGRSWGCPAVPPADMDRLIDLLADGGLLYVYGDPRASGG